MPQARVEKYCRRLDAFSERIFSPKLLDLGHDGREDVLPPYGRSCKPARVKRGGGTLEAARPRAVPENQQQTKLPKKEK